MLLRIRCRPRARECVSVVAAVRCLQCQQQGKRGPQHSLHTEQMERHIWPPVMCSSFPSCHLRILSAAQPPPRLLYGKYREAWRKMADLSRAKCRPLDGVHPWRRPIMSHAFGGVRSAAPVCLMWQESGCGFLQCQDFPESDLCDRNADLTPPVSVSAGLLCLHTCTAKLRGWRGSRNNDLLGCDRWHLLPLTSCTGRNILCVGGRRYICRSLQCGHRQDEGKWGAWYF